jgi:ankyrin repeat protein
MGEGMKIKWLAYVIFFFALCWGVRYLIAGLADQLNLSPAQHVFRLVETRDISNLKITNLKINLRYDTPVVNSVDAEGTPALIYAIRLKYFDVVQTLLEGQANPNQRDAAGNTPLMVAIMNKDPFIVQLLLDAGADPSLVNPEGLTAFMIAVKDKNEPMINLLMEHNAAALDVPDAAGQTALFLAIKEGATHLVRRLLSKGAHELIKDKSGKNILMESILARNNEFINELLLSPAGRALVMSKDDKGWTALLYAIREKEFDNARLLIEHGADIFAQSLTGDTIFSVGQLYRATLSGGGVDFITFLSEYVRDNYGPFAEQVLMEDAAAVQRSIKQNPALVNIPFKGHTPLSIAAVMDNLPVAATLIGNKATIDAADDEGNTPLMYAVKTGDRALVELLLNTSNEPHRKPATVDSANKQGETSLTIARSLVQNPRLTAARNDQQRAIYDLLLIYKDKEERLAQASLAGAT